MANENETPQTPDGSEKPNRDLSEAAKKLLALYSALPERLDLLSRAITDHEELKKALDAEIASLERLLNPNKYLTVHENPEASKLTPAVKSIYRAKKTRYESERRKVIKNLYKITVKAKTLAEKHSREIRIDDLREAVKDPQYHNKYGKRIPESFKKYLQETKKEEALKELKRLKALASGISNSRQRLDEFYSELGKHLLWNNPVLYIKSTGLDEKKLDYFDAFRKELIKWNPKN